MTSGNNGLRSPTDVAGPVGNHSIRTAGAITAPAVTDNGVSLRVAHLKPLQSADGIAIRVELVDAGEPQIGLLRIQQHGILLQRGDIVGFLQQSLRQGD